MIDNQSLFTSQTINIIALFLSRWEFKQNHEKWLTNVKPNLAPALAARTKAAMETSAQLVPLVRRIRDEAHLAINDLLKVLLYDILYEENTCASASFHFLEYCSCCQRSQTTLQAATDGGPQVCTMDLTCKLT